jgi:gliding motility-associated-like protein
VIETDTIFLRFYHFLPDSCKLYYTFPDSTISFSAVLWQRCRYHYDTSGTYYCHDSTSHPHDTILTDPPTNFNFTCSCKKAKAEYAFPYCAADTCHLPIVAVISNRTYATTDSIRVHWRKVTYPLWFRGDDSTRFSYRLFIYEQGNGNVIDTIYTTDTVAIFHYLKPATKYTIRICSYWEGDFFISDTCSALCFDPDSCEMTDTCAHSYKDCINDSCFWIDTSFTCCTSINVFTYANCVDFTNLSLPVTDVSYGTYANPYAFHAVRDYGPDSIASRHTIDTNIVKTDDRTGGLLSVIPTGYTKSVRLGNWRGGSEGEAITYTYLIDTNVFDLLLLRYAVVMVNPEGHSVNSQPTFTLVMLDSNGAELDPVCGKANFVAGQNTSQWNIAANNVYWKDWTAVGYDIAKYHGKKIRLRLTTKDCNEGNPYHFGYAYFTLECQSKNIISVACGESSANSFIAPEGFNYAWYSTNDTNTILSTNRQFDVSGSGTQYYYCIVSYIENPDCQFRINATAGNRYPIAAFTYDYTFNNCEFTVNFTNTSYVSSDSTGINMIEDHCETAQWFFNDGSSSTLNNVSHTYSSSGDYLVTLVTGLANNSCTDTLEFWIHLENTAGYLAILGDSSICFGESTTLTASMPGECLWITGDTTHSITITPASTDTISVQVIDSVGCTNTKEKIIVVNPVYDGIAVYDAICDNEYYAPDSIPLTETGIYHLFLTTIAGCDSIIWLNLQVNPTYHDTIFDTICQYDPPVEFYNNYYDSTGIYTETFQNIYGCDSTHSLNLYVKPVYTDTIKADIFKGKTFNLFGFNESEEGIYSQVYEGSNDCDSIMVLDLTVDNIIFPNVVTPNGDGINDVFVIHNLLEDNAFLENELIIYNRYGKSIYHKKNISKYSDFWSPDDSVATGTYFYRFIATRHDKTLNFTGTIDVLR